VPVLLLLKTEKGGIISSVLLLIDIFYKKKEEKRREKEQKIKVFYKVHCGVLNTNKKKDVKYGIKRINKKPKKSNLGT
jgi:hypothetical protein